MSDSDRWEVYPTEIDGELAIVVVDLACAELAPIAELPVLHWVRIAPHPAESGPEVVPDREAQESRAHDLFAAAASRAIGSITSRLRRELYWHAPEGFDPRVGLERIFDPLGEASWKHGSEPDPSWAHYSGVLLPSAPDRRRLQIARALASLAERGDRLEVPRLVEYRTMFASRSDLAAFLRASEGGGYRVTAPVESISGMWRGRVGLRHALHADEVDRHISSLSTLAEGLGGAFEGWDTHSVRGAHGP